MLFPDILEPLRATARERIASGAVAEILFSGHTYQVHCDASDDSAWVFLQLTAQNSVNDVFCGCDQCAETGHCVHMAMALLALFEPCPPPLHKKFEQSPLFPLFSAYAQVGKGPKFVRKRKGCATIAKNCVFEGPEEWIEALNRLCTPQAEETEETSIKFSDVSDAEIEAWKNKNPSSRLQFELSPYSDIAKWLFLKCRALPGHFIVNIEEGFLRIEWPDASCQIPVLGPWEEILDRLPSADTTPNIDHGIASISPDPVTRLCLVTFTKAPPTPLAPIGTQKLWYRAKNGIVKRYPHAQKALTSEDEIAHFLDAHIPPEHPLALSYHIEVIENTGMSLSTYLEHPGDLDGALFYNHWLWRKDLGFRRIQQPHFPPPQVWIQLDDCADFVTTHRHWLSTFPGFHVHDHPPKEQISFSVDVTRALVFHRQPSGGSEGQIRALGDWMFVEGKGFFTSEESGLVPFDRPIPPHRVSSFVRKEASWLEEIPNFFAQKSPIQQVELEIRAVGTSVEIAARCHWDTPDWDRTAVLYDDVGYVPNIGFFQLPPLTTAYSTPRILTPRNRDQWDHFFSEEIARLKREHACTIDPRLEPPAQLRLVCQETPSSPQATTVSPTLELIEAGLYWESEQGKVSSQILLEAFKRGERFVPTNAGLIDLDDQRFGWLQTVQAPRAGPIYRLKAFDVLKIHAHDDIAFTGSSRTAELIQRLLSASPKSPPDLSSMTSTLRSYQSHGVSWLWHLYLSGLSGLLCDDMGVGKTHQAMGLLSAAQSDARATHRPQFLIICPTSLLWHWRDKLAAALPKSKIFVYFGGKRELDQFASDDDVFVTTYGIWRNEVQTLRSIPFEIAIFDELQIAKNHVSQIWAALSQVQAKMRLGLTGTPIENQLRELKAVFDLVVPGYLPPEALFRTMSAQQTPEPGEAAEPTLLSRYVRPFILRRRKQDVLTDLPEKTEDVYTVELVGEQRLLYRQVVSRQALPLISQLQDTHAPIPYMHIFALLSALKQICNHPAAYLKDVDHFQGYESGKWDIFTELLEEALESGQKVVVFSQYLAMLDIMGLHLSSKAIPYAEIRGSTKARGEQISRFQKDQDCPVFLGSLQAAGLGIDLSAGSVVIHYDRWWNAARENQATDRVHRIGQTRGVMVYKLMTSKTIEERIDQLIAHKSQLLEDVISYDDHQIVKKMDRGELLALLEGLESI